MIKDLFSRLAWVLVPLAILLFCSIFLFVFGQISQVNCTRPEPSLIQCARTTWLFGIIPYETTNFAEVAGAYVDESCDDGCTYRVVFTTAEGDMPLTTYYSGGSSYKHDQVRQINGFLGDREQRELTVHGDRTGFYIVCGIPLALLIGGVVLTLINRLWSLFSS